MATFEPVGHLTAYGRWTDMVAFVKVGECVHWQAARDDAAKI